MTFPLRDRADADAILTDLYLDALLAAHDRRATDVPTSADLDPAIRFAAGRLSSDLARVHPSFRFEERLAARLAELAAHMRLAAAAGGSDARAPLDPSLDPHLDPAIGPDEDPAADPESLHNVRPLLLGGALTSAALSLAGAAYVAWRRSRPPLTPMARAVRAVAQSRPGGGARQGVRPRSLN